MSAPVPWNAGWTGEARYELRPCRYAGGRLAVWQPHLPGEGKPIFAKPHFVRQRRSVAEFLCTVCGERTRLTDRWWFGHGTWTGDHFMTMESPVHHKCAVLALKVCPHLRGKVADLVPFPRHYTVMASMLGGADFVSEYGFNIAPDRQVIGALKFTWHKSEIVFRGSAGAAA